MVELPCGAILPDGTVHRAAEVVKMKGETRAAVARKDVKSDFAKASDIILSQCLKRVGPSTTASREALGRMVLGDRDFLMLETRRISMSDELKANLPCPHAGCKRTIEVIYQLDEIEVRRIPDEARIVHEGRLCFRVDTKAIDGTPVKALCRFPVGADQHALQPHYRSNEVRANYRLYAMCLLQWDGAPATDKDFKFFEDMDVDLLDAFEEAFVSAQPGPIWEQEVECPNCSGPIRFSFEGSDFLYRPPRRGRT
ncbi:MAG TPA: hypothetical protein VMX57_06620 [Planctomycetota bacterium]|nr:hypothetical protein [Planctomycetota bacterium]